MRSIGAWMRGKYSNYYNNKEVKVEKAMVMAIHKRKVGRALTNTIGKVPMRCRKMNNKHLQGRSTKR